jgi:heat-inducible transcriptional repressor
VDRPICWTRRRCPIWTGCDLLDDLENKQSVAELLDRAKEGDATRIFIGSENRLFALSGSSVIASPYRDRDGRVIGVVG